MKILLHICCGPCTLFPLQFLQEQGHCVHGYFYNPNIHPFKEFRRRITALRELAGHIAFPLTIEEEYGLREYLRRVVFQEDSRCPICYDMRLEQAAKIASQTGAEAYTTTLLYSRYQQHELIREKGEMLGEKYGISFYYEDFRRGWQEGIDRSLALGLYRQPYCGCIYSEQERYDQRLRKKKR